MAFSNQRDKMNTALREAAYQKMIAEYAATGQLSDLTDAQRIQVANNPSVAADVHEYIRRQQTGKGLTAQEYANLTGNSMFNPGSYSAFDKATTQQGIIDRAAFTDMFREDGYWDMPDNDPSWWSNK